MCIAFISGALFFEYSKICATNIFGIFTGWYGFSGEWNQNWRFRISDLSLTLASRCCSPSSQLSNIVVNIVSSRKSPQVPTIRNLCSDYFDWGPIKEYGSTQEIFDELSFLQPWQRHCSWLFNGIAVNIDSFLKRPDSAGLYAGIGAANGLRH